MMTGHFPALSPRSANVRFVHRGIYESLLTDQLNQQLEQWGNLQAEPTPAGGTPDPRRRRPYRT